LQKASKYEFFFTLKRAETTHYAVIAATIALCETLFLKQSCTLGLADDKEAFRTINSEFDTKISSEVKLRLRKTPSIFFDFNLRKL
jgi:hypothetical protein